MGPKLEHIKLTACPCCGSGIDKIELYNKHTNGYWNEWVKFNCGYSVHFSPNFMKEIISNPCRKSIESIRKAEKREKATEAITNLVQSLDVDEKFKQSIIECLVSI